MALQGFWWPYRISGAHYGVLMGFGGPTGGFGDPKGFLVAIIMSLWGLVALQGGLVAIVVPLWGLVAPKELW